MNIKHFSTRANRDDEDAIPLRFPVEQARQAANPSRSTQPTDEEVFNAIENVSRRIEDLARELNCLGYFDDDGDDGPPRAA